MIMNGLKTQTIETIIYRLVEAIHPQEIYLFVSQAKANPNLPHRNSDMDLLIVVDDNAGSEMELFRQATQALHGIKFPKDIVIIHKSKKDKWAPVKFSLAHEATHKGECLYAT